MPNIIKAGEWDETNIASVALHYGSKGEDAPVLERLNTAANCNVVDIFGVSALHRAAQFNRVVIVRALLDAGADPNGTGRSGQTALMVASGGEVIRLLLKAGADINAVTIPNKSGVTAGKTAFMTATARGDLEAVAALLGSNADPNLRDELGCSALMYAAFARKHGMVEFLLGAGVKAGLPEASLIGEIRQVRVLIEEEDPSTEELANAMKWAAIGGHCDIIALLLERGVPVSTPDLTGETPLTHASQHKRVSAMRLLLSFGAGAGEGNQELDRALLNLTGSHIQDNLEAVEALLAYGASAAAQSRSGWTALMLSSLHGDSEVVELLLRNGAEPNAFTDAEFMEREEGCSTTNALMLATGNGRIETVRLLLEYGANPLLKNNADMCALSSARKHILRGNKMNEFQLILSMFEASEFALEADVLE